MAVLLTLGFGSSLSSGEIKALSLSIGVIRPGPVVLATGLELLDFQSDVFVTHTLKCVCVCVHEHVYAQYTHSCTHPHTVGLCVTVSVYRAVSFLHSKV